MSTAAHRRTERLDQLARVYLLDLPSHPFGTLRAFCRQHDISSKELSEALSRLRETKREHL
jgi:hypothetical protein